MKRLMKMNETEVRFKRRLLRFKCNLKVSRLKIKEKDKLLRPSISTSDAVTLIAGSKILTNKFDKTK